MSSREQRIELLSGRAFERYSAYRDLTIVYEGRSEEFMVRSPDISPRGMFVHIPNYFPEGAIVKVEFVLTRSRRHIALRAEVRYCLEGVGIRIEFFDIAPEDQRAIEDEIRRV